MTPEKLEIIEDEISKFEKAIYSLDLKDKKEGYRKYIDVNSFIDYFVFNEFTKNTDVGLFSIYYYKDVRGKLLAGQYGILIMPMIIIWIAQKNKWI